MIHAIEVHRILLKISDGRNTYITVKDLATEMNVPESQMYDAIETLQNLFLVNLDPKHQSIALTPTGALANISQ
ncbi:MAG TPA: hypothetical protein PL009_05630 [Flavipsychrobacter sp.]|nr:hypothetical protein [Flavipsychrobacter sp.]